MTRNGTLIINGSQKSTYVIWEDNHCRPEPFPIIFTHSTKQILRCPIEMAQGNIKVYSSEFDERHIMWPGSETLTVVTSKHIKHTSKHPDRLVATVSVTKSPIEVSIQDDKQVSISLQNDKPMKRGVRLCWDPKSSVLRNPSTKEIIGIPQWTIWKNMCKRSYAFDVCADLQWNPIVEKYQVSTLK